MNLYQKLKQKDSYHMYGGVKFCLNTGNELHKYRYSHVYNVVWITVDKMACAKMLVHKRYKNWECIDEKPWAYGLNFSIKVERETFYSTSLNEVIKKAYHYNRKLCALDKAFTTDSIRKLKLTKHWKPTHVE